jgi:hypothetical protein
MTFCWSIFAQKEYMLQHIKKCKCIQKMIEMICNIYEIFIIC